jgi:hypothetical protein
MKIPHHVEKIPSLHLLPRTILVRFIQKPVVVTHATTISMIFSATLVTVVTPITMRLQISPALV